MLWGPQIYTLLRLDNLSSTDYHSLNVAPSLSVHWQDVEYLQGRTAPRKMACKHTRSTAHASSGRAGFAQGSSLQVMKSIYAREVSEGKLEQMTSRTTALPRATALPIQASHLSRPCTSNSFAGISNPPFSLQRISAGVYTSTTSTKGRLSEDRGKRIYRSSESEIELKTSLVSLCLALEPARPLWRDGGSVAKISAKSTLTSGVRPAQIVVIRNVMIVTRSNLRLA